MKIIGFNHFQLDSADVERTRRFYEALGGQVTQVMERGASWKGYHVRLAEGVTIEIQPPRIPEECGGADGWDHLALLTGDCAGLSGKIQAAGGRIEKPPTDNRLGDTPIRNAVTYGVDGEKIEVIEVLGQHGGADVLGVSHMQLNSSDVERSRAFYEQAFGGRVKNPIMTKDGSAVKGYMVELAPGSVLEIQPPRFPLTGKKSAWNTIAIETDDMEGAIDRIVAAGGIREVGPLKGQMGTIAIRNAVMIGPDDEHIELIELI